VEPSTPQSQNTVGRGRRGGDAGSPPPRLVHQHVPRFPPVLGSSQEPPALGCSRPQRWCWRIHHRGFGVLEGVWAGLGRWVCTPGLGSPSFPLLAQLLLQGLDDPQVPKESLISVTESHRDPAALQQVGPGPQGQGPVKRASSFRPESVGWREGDAGGQGHPMDGGHQVQGKYCAARQWRTL